MHELNIDAGAPSGALPLVIRPSRPASAEALASLVHDEHARLLRLLQKHGALLFRGFAVDEPDDLARVMSAEGAAPMRYVGGISPRQPVAETIYGATDLPPGVRIPLHNELSYLAVYPRQLWFACRLPAARGGETTLADARIVYDSLDERVRARFVERGVRYECSFHGDSLFWDLIERFQKVTKSWQEAFETDDRSLVAERCRELRATLRWLDSGRLVLETRRPAAVAHPDTGERVWFSSAHLFHINPRGIGWLRYLLARLFSIRKEARTHEASYGDGTPIGHEDLAHLFDVLDAATVAIEWQRGDALWIDNLLCMHGRNPYHGERSLLAALSR